jgi:hypothetical protein
MKHLPYAFALLLVAFGACGGDDDPAPADAAGGPDAGSPGTLAPPPAGEGLQLDMQANVAAGDEVTYCQYYVLPAEVIDIARFEHAYTTGSHHMLLFPTTKTAAEAAGDLAPFVCATRGDLGNRGVAYGAQSPDGELVYPTGVAFQFESETVVMMQAHYYNPTDDPVDADVRVNMWFATEPVTQYAGTLFYYDWAIVVPPMPATATARMQCVVPQDINILFASSHMHRRGVGYRSELTGAPLTEPRSLFETLQWESPDPAIYDPALPVTAGQIIHYECDYQNDLAQTVVQGPSAETNEMCMFVAGYYPRLPEADENCFTPGSGPLHDGAATCLQTMQCLGGAGDEIARQTCMTQTCRGSSIPFADVALCMVGNGCADPFCAPCASQWSACQSATCN